MYQVIKHHESFNFHSLKRKCWNNWKTWTANPQSPTGFQVYFWICVYSLLMRMKKELKLMAKSQQYQPNLEYLPRPAEPAISQPACNIRVSQVPMRQPDNFNFPSVPVVFPGLGFGMANSMQKMFKMWLTMRFFKYIFYSFFNLTETQLGLRSLENYFLKFGKENF